TIVPVFVPAGSADASEVIVNVSPSGPIVPDAGVTFIHGLSPRAVNCVGVAGPAMKTVCTTELCVPTSTFGSELGGVTMVLTTSEYGPRSSLQLLTPRTRYQYCVGTVTVRVNGHVTPVDVRVVAFEKSAFVASCPAYSFVFATALQRTPNCTPETVRPTTVVSGFSGVPHGGAVLVATNIAVAECVDGQPSNVASTNQPIVPAGTSATSAVVVVVPMTLGPLLSNDVQTL